MTELEAHKLASKIIDSILYPVIFVFGIAVGAHLK
jgi:hypothetical protein